LGQRQRRPDGRTCSCCSGERQLDGGWRIVVDCERQHSRPGSTSWLVLLTRHFVVLGQTVWTDKFGKTSVVWWLQTLRRTQRTSTQKEQHFEWNCDEFFGRSGPKTLRSYRQLYRGLPCDAMRKPCVCLSVCQSVRHVTRLRMSPYFFFGPVAPSL